jgi:hypothetical protein
MTGLRCAPVPANETPMVPVKGQTGLAWVVVLTFLFIGGMILLVSAFSQDNTPSSINGRTATTSHQVP